MIGMALRLILPEHHLNADSKDVIKMGTGLTATMSALVLALLIASAKSSYDAQRNEVTQISAVGCLSHIYISRRDDSGFGHQDSGCHGGYRKRLEEWQAKGRRFLRRRP